MILRVSIICSLGVFAVCTCHAADLPLPSSDDARIRIVLYKPNDVTLIRVKRGVATRIILAPDEKIEIPVSGLSARCSVDTDEWCIDAGKGSNQIFVRPRDNAVRNNMELKTNKRDYSFDFEVIPDSVPYPPVAKSKTSSAELPFFRVVFDYPKPPTPVITRAAAVDDLLRRLEATDRPAPIRADDELAMSPIERLKSEGIEIKNSSYSKQVLNGGTDAEPSLVFDDGRFTYFEFQGAREVPAIFIHGSDDQPMRANVHMQGSFVVVQRTAKRFTLRLGGAVVGIFNEDYDAVGIDTPTSTLSPFVKRAIKDGS